MKFNKPENIVTNANRISKSSKETEPSEKKQQITIKRSSGRKEKFDTERMAQTIGRSGVPFSMARDVAKKVSHKIEHKVRDKQTKRNGNQQLKEKTVTGGTIRKLVDTELRDRNRSDIAASYSGQTPENTLQEQNLKDKQPNVDPATANRSRVLHDTSKRGGGIMT